jgi:hypothetical protein
MRTIPVLGAALASILAFPGSASAHTATAVIDCTAVKATYTAFAPNRDGKTNTVHYKVTVDGATTNEANFVLASNGGREGTLTLPSAPADGSEHTLAFYTAWGANGGTQTVDGNSSGSMTSPLASAQVKCGSPPAPQPSPSPSPSPSPQPAMPAPPAQPAAPPPVSAPTAPAASPLFPSVKGAEAAKPADCVSLPKAYRVRAGQMNTIVVQVRVGGKDIEGAKVKLTAPGITQIKETDSRGTVTFRVKPRKSGKLYVQSDQCAGADRGTVLAAKRSSGRAAPRFTG